MNYNKHAMDLEPLGSSGFVPYDVYAKSKRNQAKKVETKGSLPKQNLDESLADDENLYIVSQKQEERKASQSVLLRKCFIVCVCLVMSLVLNLFSFQVPYTPSLVSIDFSSLAELLAAFTVHPLISVAIILLKNGVYCLINPGAVPSVPGKIIINVAFVLFTWLFYVLLTRTGNKEDGDPMTSEIKRDFSSERVLLCGTASALVTAILSVLTFKTVTMPLVAKYLGQDMDVFSKILLANYRQAFDSLTVRFDFVAKIVPSIDSLTEALLFYNITMNFAKFFISALIVSVVFAVVRTFIYKNQTGLEQK